MKEFVPYEKPRRSSTLYVSTNKSEPELLDYPTQMSRDNAFVYWWWSQRVGSTPGMTVREAYQEIGGPSGLSYSETESIMKGATQMGFLVDKGKKPPAEKR